MALMTFIVQSSFKDSMNKVLLSSANLRWWPQIQYVNRTFLKEISIVLKEAIIMTLIKIWKSAVKRSLVNSLWSRCKLLCLLCRPTRKFRDIFSYMGDPGNEVREETSH